MFRLILADPSFCTLMIYIACECDTAGADRAYYAQRSCLVGPSALLVLNFSSVVRNLGIIAGDA